MPRAARKRAETDIYHVILRGTAKQLIFEDDDDRKFFLSLIEKNRQPCLEVLAWCLMNNHVHLLLRDDIKRISPLVQKVASQHASRFNAIHGRVGHLFQERFMSECVKDDAQLLQTLRYIHANPLKAGMTNDFDYEWSSYGEYVGKREASGILDESLVMSMFGSAEEFEQFHRAYDIDTKGFDVTEQKAVITDEKALLIAHELLGEDSLYELAAADRKSRNEALRKLKSAGLGVRQIQRITGLSLSMISRA